MAKKLASTPRSLPAEYLQWLAALGANPAVIVGDRQWELANQKTLSKTVNIDGKKRPYIEQTRLFAQMLAEVTGESATVDERGKEVPFARVENWLTIGYDNEDVLCVDPADQFSVWCFHPSDGGDVERIAKSLTQWIKKAVVAD